MDETSVLIVDDHPAVRFGIAALISREQGLRIFGEAGSREDVFRLLRKDKPDLAIVDLYLHNRRPTGIELIRDIISIERSLPVIVVSVNEHIGIVERAFEAGAVGYVSKRAPVTDVLSAIRTVLAGGMWGKPERSARTPHAPAFFVDPVRLLSRREFEVLRLIGQGSPARHLARILNVSVKTVEAHKLNIRRKLRLASTGELSEFAVSWVRNAETETQGLIEDAEDTRLDA